MSWSYTKFSWLIYKEMFSSWRREFTIRSWGLKGLTLIFRLWLWPFTLCFYSNKICLHNQIHTAHGERWTLTKDSKSGKPNKIFLHIKGKLGNTTAGHATNSVQRKWKKNEFTPCKQVLPVFLRFCLYSIHKCYRHFPSCFRPPALKAKVRPPSWKCDSQRSVGRISLSRIPAQILLRTHPTLLLLFFWPQKLFVPFKSCMNLFSERSPSRESWKVKGKNCVCAAWIIQRVQAKQIHHHCNKIIINIIVII